MFFHVRQTDASSFRPAPRHARRRRAYKCRVRRWRRTPPIELGSTNLTLLNIIRRARAARGIIILGSSSSSPALGVVGARIYAMRAEVEGDGDGDLVRRPGRGQTKLHLPLLAWTCWRTPPSVPFRFPGPGIVTSLLATNRSPSSRPPSVDPAAVAAATGRWSRHGFESLQV